jgi:hypothetical protein
MAARRDRCWGSAPLPPSISERISCPFVILIGMILVGRSWTSVVLDLPHDIIAPMGCRIPSWGIG